MKNKKRPGRTPASLADRIRQIFDPAWLAYAPASEVYRKVYTLVMNDRAKRPTRKPARSPRLAKAAKLPVGRTV